MKTVFNLSFKALVPAVLLVVFCWSTLYALPVPSLQARVNDYAGMLSSQTEQQLDIMLRNFEATDSTQIVVLTIPSLEGENLEDFSIRVADEWKIGHKGKDNGAILLIAKKDRAIRIEVGYGLEGRLTDLIAGRIIRNIMAPQFRAGNIDKGVLDAVSAMIASVRGEFAAEPAPEKGPDRVSSGIGMMVFVLFAMNILGRLHRWVGAAAGGLLLPLVGSLIFGLGALWLLALIPLGVGAGLLAGFLGGPLVFGHSGGSGPGGGTGHGGFWLGGMGGGSGGGFGGGGFGGGFGGGGFGGGFGGGGASGGW
ncbi:MAG: TPM domain-containing protein [Thermodesulfobacteriota bacterium]|nr:TPM domain-containing protein [Thermodesulfobacteriota bacterium]